MVRIPEISCFYVTVISFLSPFPQAVLWRIHKANVPKLGPSVIEVSYKGRVRQAWRWGLFCRTYICVCFCSKETTNNTQTLMYKYLCVHVFGTDNEEECNRQGEPLLWIEMTARVIVHSITNILPCLLQLKWRKRETHRLQQLNRLAVSLSFSHTHTHTHTLCGRIRSASISFDKILKTNHLCTAITTK